jgi:hypothetical protein
MSSGPSVRCTRPSSSNRPGRAEPVARPRIGPCESGSSGQRGRSGPSFGRSLSSGHFRSTTSDSSRRAARPVGCSRGREARWLSRTRPLPTSLGSTLRSVRPVQPRHARLHRGSPLPAPSSSTTRRRGGWTRTSRWWSRRSTRVPSPRSRSGSSPTPTARRWSQCRPSSRCTTRRGCDDSSSRPTRPSRVAAWPG